MNTAPAAAKTVTRIIANNAPKLEGLAPAAQSWVNVMEKPLVQADPTLAAIMEKEKHRQLVNLNLIASENFTSKAVLQSLGSHMSNKYSEGYPGQRYYGGNRFIDEAERLCQQRALEAFRLDPEQWGVNVQPLSGTPANFAVYSALLKPHDRIMALDLPHGGHLSHGYSTPTKKISAVSTYFECLPYHLHPVTEEIDYDMVDKLAPLYRPKLIIAGASAYARVIDHARMRAAADSVGAYLMGDMAHISGLVAAGVIDSPFDHCDVVTTTTHKSLRGPRGAMIFFRKGVRGTTKKGKEIMYDLEDRINFSVFPGHQGGPHNHTISALATALLQANSPEFVEYQKAVMENAQAFCAALTGRGYKFVSGGTSNHLVLMTLRGEGVDGARAESVLDAASLTVNKNTVPGDVSALQPHGLRMGTPALTTRGFQPSHFEHVAGLVDRGVQLAKEIKAGLGKHRVSEFTSMMDHDTPSSVLELKEEVEDFASRFPIVGHDVFNC